MPSVTFTSHESVSSQPVQPIIGEFGPIVPGYRQRTVSPAEVALAQALGGSLLPVERIEAGLRLLPDDLSEQIEKWRGDWQYTVRATIAADLKGEGQAVHKFWIMGLEDANGNVPDEQLLASRIPAGVLIGFNGSNTKATARFLHIAQHLGERQVGVGAARGRLESPLFGVELYQNGYFGVHNNGFRTQGGRFLGYNESPLFIACAPDRPKPPTPFPQGAKRVVQMALDRVVEGLRAA